MKRNDVPPGIDGMETALMVAPRQFYPLAGLIDAKRQSVVDYRGFHEPGMAEERARGGRGGGCRFHRLPRYRTQTALSIGDSPRFHPSILCRSARGFNLLVERPNGAVQFGYPLPGARLHEIIEPGIPLIL